MTTTCERRHLDHLRRQNLSPRTRRDREGALRRLAGFLDKPLLEATPEDLERWQAGLRVSISAVSTYTSHVKSFYRWALEQGHLDSDPATLLPRPKLPRRSPRASLLFHSDRGSIPRASPCLVSR